MQNPTTHFRLLLLTGLIALSSLHFARGQVVTGSNLNIGAGNNISTSSTYNSIAGGNSNTNLGIAHSSVGGGIANKISSRGYATIIGGGSGNYADDSYTTIAGGVNNGLIFTNMWNGVTLTNADNVASSAIGGGVNNHVWSKNSVISGGNANLIEPYADHSTISGGLLNTIELMGGYATISGGSQNTIENGAWWGAINGGEFNEISGLVLTNLSNVGSNINFHHFGWIGGGYSNYLTGYANWSSLGAGWGNQIHAQFGTIGGGVLNYIGTNTANLGDAGYGSSTISGGTQNTIGTNSHWNNIGGGALNRITNLVQGACIPGGYDNSCLSAYTFAAGTRATPIHQGSFVWSDTTTGRFYSTANNDFSVRSYGGARFVTGAGTGATLAAGSGSWSSTSDRNAKDHFQPVDKRKVLEKVSTLPLMTWNYKSQEDSIRHMGPVSQDFKAAFELGENDTTISTVDINGIALASIQALNEIVGEKDKSLKEQAATIQKLESRLEAIEKLLKHD